jgi:hypothetical protein
MSAVQYFLLWVGVFRTAGLGVIWADYIGNITAMNEGRCVHQINEHNPFNINIEFNINPRRPHPE